MTRESGREAVLKAKKEGKQVVGVLGLGFVGTAVIANLARTEHQGSARFFVIGVDQDTPEGRAKCERLNSGIPPVYAQDHDLAETFSKAAKQTQNIWGSVDFDAFSLVDVVVICINLDLKRKTGQTKALEMNVKGYGEAVRKIGQKIRPGVLVTVESTLPVGMCDQVIYPALCQGQQDQGIDLKSNPPLLAYCYERVMPGPGYLNSVNHYWRTFAGMNPTSAKKAREFLTQFVNTKDFPLWEHKTTRAAEMGKLLENAYRATNIAFISEWADLAERAQVDLFDVISSIRVRKGTHDNMMLPGLGVGGYCLTKDALLAAYGAQELLKVDAPLVFSRQAILTNEQMPLKSVDWICQHFENSLSGKKTLLLGISYRPGVADSRYSASEIVARALLEKGVELTAFDPLLKQWDEFPSVPIVSELPRNTQKWDIVVICLPDRQFEAFLPSLLSEQLQKGSIVIDPWNVLGDARAKELTRRGIAVKVYGRGDLGETETTKLKDEQALSSHGSSRLNRI